MTTASIMAVSIFRPLETLATKIPDKSTEYYNFLCKTLDWNNLGNYYAGGCTGCEKNKRVIAEKHLLNAYQTGKSI